MGQVIPSVKAPNLAPRGGAGHRPAARRPRPHRQPRLRLRQPGHRRRRRGDPAGQAEVGIAGGAESLSDVPDPAQPADGAGAGRGLAGAVAGRRGSRAFAALRPRDLVPETPAIAEPSTGLTMGQSAEKMAKENGITPRGAGPDRATAATRTPAAAVDDGRLAGRDVRGAACRRATTPPSTPTTCCGRDTIAGGAGRRCRPCSTASTARSPPGNSSPLTDGAAAVLLMSEERARAEGYEPLAFIRSWAIAAVDPGGQLLMGPGARHPAGARARRPDARGHGPDRDARGVRGPGRLEHPGPRVATSGRARSSGRSEPVGKVDRETPQRLRRLDRGRPSLRRHRRAHHDDARERDGAPRRPLRPALRLRPGRAWASRWCWSGERAARSPACACST